jgi:hypothetical protein
VSLVDTGTLEDPAARVPRVGEVGRVLVALAMVGMISVAEEWSVMMLSSRTGETSPSVKLFWPEYYCILPLYALFVA